MHHNGNFNLHFNYSVDFEVWLFYLSHLLQPLSSLVFPPIISCLYLISCNFIALLPLDLVLIPPSYASIKLYFFFELLCSKQCCRMKNWHTFEEVIVFLLADIGDLYICAWSPLMLCLSLFVYDCYSCDAVLNGRESEFNPIFVITCWTCMWNLINYKKTKHCIWRLYIKREMCKKINL